MQRGLLGLVAIGDKGRQEVDHKGERAAKVGMLELADDRNTP